MTSIDWMTNPFYKYIINTIGESNMSKEQTIINYYNICNKLKDVVRTGWKYFNVKRNRVESIAEHIFGVQMLAIAMKSEYQYDIDIMKVIYMLAIHELGEAIIGDLMPSQMKNEEKEKIEHEAVHKILSSLIDGKQIEDLFLEFDAHKTPEAKFAFQCDKLESDIQCKLYDEEGCVDISKHKDYKTYGKELLKKKNPWSKKWIETHQKEYQYDEFFMRVSNYIKDNDICN